MVISLILPHFLCIFPCLYLSKGQLISKSNCQAMNSSKKQTNQFVFTTMRCIFVPFLEEIEGIQKTFRNYLTFSCGNTFAIRPFWGHSKKMVTGMLSLGFIGHFC